VTEVTMKKGIFMDVTHYSLVEMY